jgi:hypothetical protein
MQPLATVIAFDVGKQVMPGSIPGWIASLLHEFRFDRAKAVSIIVMVLRENDRG